VDISEDDLALAALLERAYRLALVVQQDLLPEVQARQHTALELDEVLDDARLLLLNANRPAKPP